jgi:hypothetical protein
MVHRCLVIAGLWVATGGLLGQAPIAGRILDVADLVMTRRSPPLLPLLPIPAELAVLAEDPRIGEDADGPISADSLLTLLATVIGRAGIPGGPDASMHVLTPEHILVQGSPEVLEAAARTLAAARAAATTGLLVEVWSIPRASVRDPGTTILDAGATARLREDPGSVLLARVPAPPHWRVESRSTAEHRLLADYHVEVAQESEVADPVVLCFQDGFAVQIQADPVGEATHLRVSLRQAALVRTRLVQPRSTTIGSLELPDFHVTAAEVSARVPSLGGLLLGAVQGPADPLVLVAVGALPPPLPIPGHMLLHAGRAGTPLVRVPALPVPVVDVAGPMLGSGREEAIHVPEGYDLARHLQEQLAAGGVEPDRGVEVLGNLLVPPVDPGSPAGAAAQAAIARWDAELLPVHGLELAFGRVDHAGLRALASGGGPDPEVLARLEGRARACAAGGDGFLVLHGRQFAYLSEHDVEIAQDARVADPIVSGIFTGFAFRGRCVALDQGTCRLLGEFLVRDLVGELRSFDGNADHVGIIELPRTQTVHARIQADLPAEGWVLLHAVERPASADVLVLCGRQR